MSSIVLTRGIGERQVRKGVARRLAKETERASSPSPRGILGRFLAIGFYCRFCGIRNESNPGFQEKCHEHRKGSGSHRVDETR